MRLLALALLLSAVSAGCVPMQSNDTPVSAQRLEEMSTRAHYWLYKPSYYDESREWPLVITLHGTHGWDPASWQMIEWQQLAEDKGLIVVAPELKSPQGILPVIHGLWYDDLQRDDRVVLSIMDEVCRNYKVDRNAVLLTGFSAGGYPMYNIGLRHPERFSMLIARSCNTDLEMMKSIPITAEARRLPVMVFCGKDELKPIINQSWAAFRFLRENGCKKTEHTEIPGGHLRRPELAYKFWLKYLPKQHHADQ